MKPLLSRFKQVEALCLQTQHVGDWPPGNSAEEPSLEGLFGAHSDAQMLFFGSRAERSVTDSNKAAPAENSYGLKQQT